MHCCDHVDRLKSNWTFNSFVISENSWMCNQYNAKVRMWISQSFHDYTVGLDCAEWNIVSTILVFILFFNCIFSIAGKLKQIPHIKSSDVHENASKKSSEVLNSQFHYFSFNRNCGIWFSANRNKQKNKQLEFVRLLYRNRTQLFDTANKMRYMWYNTI